MAVDPRIETLALLRSIDASLKALVASQPAGNGPQIADDRDLDSQYGDPTVKFNPRDWHGDSCKGLAMSQCPPEFLDLIAQTFDYFAKKADESGETTTTGKLVAPYKRKDAARARGWALRLRNGWKPDALPTQPVSSGFEQGESEWPAENDIPF
jgi:hypothetical protein